MALLLLIIIKSSFIALVAASHPEYYSIETESDETANGCYQKTNRTNPQDYFSGAKFPIYKKTSPPVLYMMLENTGDADHGQATNGFGPKI